MGLKSPSASANRRIAPFSTSFRVGGDERPMAFLSSMMGPLADLASRRKIEHREEPRLCGRDAWSGVYHELRGRGVPRNSAGDVDAQACIGFNDDLVTGRLCS